MTGRPGDSLSAFNPSRISPTPLSLWTGHARSMSPDGAQADALESGGGFIDLRRRDSGEGDAPVEAPRRAFPPLARRGSGEKRAIYRGFHEGHPARAVVAVSRHAGDPAGALANAGSDPGPAGAFLRPGQSGPKNPHRRVRRQ